MNDSSDVYYLDRESLKNQPDRLYLFNVDYKFAVIAALLVTQFAMMQAVWAQQCFIDAEHAYTYLIKQEQYAQQSSDFETEAQRVNINTATEAELTTLKGIGSTKAQDIILYRQSFGRFDSVDALTEIKGIGEKTVAKNRARLSVH